MSACGIADIPADMSDTGGDPAIGKPVDIPSPDTKAHAFDDVPDWYADAADWAAAEGIHLRSRHHAAHLESLRIPRRERGRRLLRRIVRRQLRQGVGWAVTNGITGGTGGGKFGPSDPCTRGHIVTFLHRAYVPSVRLDTGTNDATSDANASADDAAAEKTLSSYGTIQTLVKSVSNPTAVDSGNKNTTSYGTVDWSTAAQGYISFTAAGQEQVFILQRPDGMQSNFGLAKNTTAKIALTGGTGTYQYIIGRYTEDKSVYWADYKNTIQIGKIDAGLAPYLVSTPYGDYADAPNATAKAKELYDSSKTQLENIQAMAKYVDGLKYDMSMKQGGSSAYVNPDTVIANGGGVCNEMSKLLVAMLRSQGIPAYYQGGTESGDSHAWVMAWVELSAETKDDITCSKGAWVLVEATSGKVQTKSAAASYTPVNCAS